MDFLFICMPYAKFDSKWFANVPNVNLGILDALLTEKGKQVKSFHFHLEFLPFLEHQSKEVVDRFSRLSGDWGIEYVGLDYVFASLLFETVYDKARDRFAERFNSVGLTLHDFEILRRVAGLFVDTAFSRLSPYLKGTKLVGFSCSHYQLSSSLLLCSKIKEAFPEIRTIVGGKDCSGRFAQELLSNAEYLDFVGIGEAEVTIVDLLAHLDDPAQPLCNLVLRNAAGEPMKADLKPNYPVKALPFPRYDFQRFPIALSDVILPLELGRGCPWGKCTFCPDESYGIRCQSKTVDQVQGEIESYREISEELSNFIILDSDSLKDPKLIYGLSEYLHKKGMSFHFAEFRAQKMDRKVLEALLRFGHWISPFQVGIESFSDRILRLMKKGVSVLKNVEVLKIAAQLGIPLQFNLFTCYPNMTREDLAENVRVMDLIAHVLVHENIQIFPGEFYLPTDCPVFLNTEQYALEKHLESIFAVIFEDFPMPSYSNYPYPYQFDNDEEQFQIAQAIRQNVKDIKKKDSKNNFMWYQKRSGALDIALGCNGRTHRHVFEGTKAEIYLSAVDEIQRIKDVGKKFGLSESELAAILDDFARKGLILRSTNGQSFLALAMESRELH